MSQISSSLPGVDAGWLTLKDAAERLGIHPTTLRRWADSGKIPHMITPGGHRRFATADVDRLTKGEQRRRVVSGIEQMWAKKAMTHTRAEMAERHDARWLTAADPAGREAMRLMGRRLMGVLMQYIALSDGDVDSLAVLAEAETIGRAYGDYAFAQNMSLTDSLKATMFFRDAMVEAAIQLPESARIRPEANGRLLRRINTILNQVQLAIAAAYEKDSDKITPEENIRHER